MKLQGISINVVRNEYEYNKYVSEECRRQYDYEASKSSLPWIIIDFAKYNALEDFVSNSELTFSPAADFYRNKPSRKRRMVCRFRQNKIDG